MLRINRSTPSLQSNSVKPTEGPRAPATETAQAQAPKDGFQTWDSVKVHDASARAALRKLEKTAGAEVSADELRRAITAGTADKDGQFTNKEFKQYADWALRNAGRLSDGAEQVMAIYRKAAKAAHGKPLSSDEYKKVMSELAAVADPKAPPKEDASVLDHPNRWFISQTKTRKYNSREDDGSGNCGPTCLTMAAKAFGKVNGGAWKMDQAIEHSRRKAMHAGRDEDYGTSIYQIKHGAEEHYGLKAKLQHGHGSNVTRKLNDTIDHIKANLEKGRPVIVHGVMIRSMHDSRASKYGEGGHYFMVTKIAKNKHGEWVAHLNDPAWPDGPRTVPLSRVRESIRRRGTFATLAVWDKKDNKKVG